MEVENMRPEEFEVLHFRPILLKHITEKNKLKAEQVREKIDIMSCIAKLGDLIEQSKTCPIEDLERLKFQASVITTILKKVMPDLKSIEVSEKNNNTRKLIIDLVASSDAPRTPGE